MFDSIEERLAANLASQQVGVISSAGPDGPWSMPVRYKARRLTAMCFVPSWSDLLFFLELDPRAILVVLTPSPEGAGWMQLRGMARIVTDAEAARWEESSKLRPVPTPNRLYKNVHFTPTRIRRFDSLSGWGKSESFDLA